MSGKDLLASQFVSLLILESEFLNRQIRVTEDAFEPPSGFSWNESFTQDAEIEFPLRPAVFHVAQILARFTNPTMRTDQRETRTEELRFTRPTGVLLAFLRH